MLLGGGGQDRRGLWCCRSACFWRHMFPCLLFALLFFNRSTEHCIIVYFCKSCISFIVQHIPLYIQLYLSNILQLVSSSYFSSFSYVFFIIFIEMEAVWFNKYFLEFGRVVQTLQLFWTCCLTSTPSPELHFLFFLYPRLLLSYTNWERWLFNSRFFLCQPWFYKLTPFMACIVLSQGD